MTIKYYTKIIYGTEFMYIADRDIDETVRILTMQKTISRKQMLALERLGLKFKRVFEPITN